MEHPKILKEISKVLNRISKNFRKFDKNYQKNIDFLQIFRAPEKPRTSKFKSSNSQKGPILGSKNGGGFFCIVCLLKTVHGNGSYSHHSFSWSIPFTRCTKWPKLAKV